MISDRRIIDDTTMNETATVVDSAGEMFRSELFHLKFS